MKKQTDIKKAVDIPELAAAEEYGIDVKMLLDNLDLTISQRIKRHQTALDTIEKLSKAGRE